MRQGTRAARLLSLPPIEDAHAVFCHGALQAGREKKDGSTSEGGAKRVETTHDERIRRLAVRPRLDHRRLLLALRAGRTRRRGRLGFPTRRTRVVPMLLLDSYPDPIFPPDVELGVFGLGEQLFHGRAGVVGGFGGEPEVGATVVVAVRSEQGINILVSVYDPWRCTSQRNVRCRRTRWSNLAARSEGRVCRRRIRPRLDDRSIVSLRVVVESMGLVLAEHRLTDDSFRALRLDLADEGFTDVRTEDD